MTRIWIKNDLFTNDSERINDTIRKLDGARANLAEQLVSGDARYRDIIRSTMDKIDACRADLVFVNRMADLLAQKENQS